MTFGVAHWDTWDDTILVYHLSLIMSSVGCLHFIMQEEDILQHTNAPVSFVYTLVNLYTSV